jgi:hypothetical protein
MSVPKANPVAVNKVTSFILDSEALWEALSKLWELSLMGKMR